MLQPALGRFFGVLFRKAETLMLTPKWKARLFGIGALTFLLLGVGGLYIAFTGGITPSQPAKQVPSPAPGSPAQHPLRGKAAPDFSLKQMNGETFRLSDYRGEIVVVNFWATWCAPCRKEIPGFIALQEEWADKGVTFVGVSLDDEGFEVVRPYAEKMGINYPLVVGDDRLTKKYGGVQGLPTSFVVGPEGTVQSAHLGFWAETELRNQLRPLMKRAETDS